MRFFVTSIYGLISTSAQFFTSQAAQFNLCYNVAHIDEFDKHLVRGEMGNIMKVVTSRATNTQRAVNTDYVSKDTPAATASSKGKRSTAATAVTRCAFLCTGNVEGDKAFAEREEGNVEGKSAFQSRFFDFVTPHTHNDPADILSRVATKRSRFEEYASTAPMRFWYNTCIVFSLMMSENIIPTIDSSEHQQLLNNIMIDFHAQCPSFPLGDQRLRVQMM